MQEKDLVYYEKLGFNNVESWSEEDLTNFLVWDWVELIEKEGYGNFRNFIKNDLQKTATKNKAVKYRVAVFVLDMLNNLFIARKKFLGKSKERILFFDINQKYFHNIIPLGKKYDVCFLARGIRDRICCIGNFFPAKPFSKAIQFAAKYMTEHKKEYLYALVSYINQILKKTRPKYVVMSGDCSIESRAMVVAAKQLGILTIAVQQSIFPESDFFYYGKVVDYALFWGQYFKDMYLKHGGAESRAYILGYPYSTSNKRIHKKHKYTLYYFDQAAQLCNNDFFMIKINTLRGIGKICRNLGMEFICRPHPTDNRSIFKRELPEIKISSKNEKLEQSIKKGDIFISFCSTALIEATMMSKITLQLMNYPVKPDNFEKLGICNKSFENIEDLENYLKKISKADDLKKFIIKFNNYYAETRYNLAERFYELMEKIRTY